MLNQTRRNFSRNLIVAGPLAAAGSLRAQQPESPPQLKIEVVKEYVSKSHAALDVVKELTRQEPMLLRASWDWGAGDWETGLGAASHMGRRDIAKFLIDSGARIDVFAVFMLGELSSAKTLLAAFPGIHKTPGPHGIPLLTHAIVGKQDSFDAFQLLIKAKADVNAATWKGVTPLMQAVATEQPDVVRVLLDHGANPAAKTPAGVTALDVARKKENAAIIAMLSGA